jgi:ubiquitin-protein ligase
MEPLTTSDYYIEYNNGELEKIGMRSLKNRTKNECNELYKKYHNVLIVYENNKICLTAVELIDAGKRNRIYKFILTPEYPFKPPEIYVNNYLYSTVLQIKGDFEKSMVKKLKGHDCLCCHSLNCSANWSPAVRLYRIIDEIKDTLKFKRDIINLIMVDKIKKRYNIPYAYIEKFLVPFI